MAAPEAPVIKAIQTGGGQVRVTWYEVPDATDYNIYFGDTPNPTGIEDSVSDSEVEDNGLFRWFSDPVYAGHVYVRVTALNAMAEESAYSNEKGFYLNESNVQSQNPTRALDHIRKGA